MISLRAPCIGTSSTAFQLESPCNSIEERDLPPLPATLLHGCNGFFLNLPAPFRFLAQALGRRCLHAGAAMGNFYFKAGQQHVGPACQ